MDNTEAQYVLRAFRPGTKDEGDPRFREALARVESDPELAAWFRDEMDWDRNLRDTLGSTPVPADLRGQILAGQQAEVLPGTRWGRPSHWAWAASLALALGLTAHFVGPDRPKKEPEAFARFQLDMARTLGKPGHVDLAEHDMETIRRWLARKGGHPELMFPAGLMNRPVMGCSVFDWNDLRVTLICFQVGEAGSPQEAHLLIVDQGQLAGAPLDCTPIYRHDAHLASYGWTDGRRDYVLAARGAEADLAPYF